MSTFVVLKKKFETNYKTLRGGKKFRILFKSKKQINFKER